MKSLLITLAASAVTFSGMGAARQTNYSELTNLTDMVSAGLFHGNTLLADINNDGNYELIAKGRDLNAGWANTLKALYLDESGSTFVTSTDLDTPDDCMWERIIYPIDYNNDGNLDLIYASSWNAKLMKGDGTGRFEMVEDFALDGEMSIDGDDAEKWYAGTLGVADFNGDGYQDIVTFCGNPREDQGTPVVFFNDKGSGKFIKDENTGIKPQRGGTLCVGDYNGDGYQDILVSGWADDFGTDCCRIWKNDGTGKFTEVIVGNTAGTEKGQVIFADLTGNGLLDVFITGTSCPNNWELAAYIYTNNGDDTFTRLDAGLPGFQCSGADWCDLNGDGHIDLVYAGENGDLKNSVYAFNEGDGTFTAVTDKLGQHRGGASVLACDMNNNNVPDILLMGYMDGDGARHFQVYNGAGSRVANKAPNAPTGLVATAEGNRTILSWNAATDEKASQGTGATPAEALRYNYYVKTSEGSLITAVPADPATGKLRSSNVCAASSALKVELSVPSSDIVEWGVQAIDGAKAAGVFAKADMSGVVSIEAAEAAEAEYFNLQGIRVANPGKGLYIRRQGSATEKICIR
ncbi:MAG: VCBS repeat-containing protein [Muribaculaceae bacterium]|nr:VCBS repeat-containing protein [Muribaculaceae bacterium]